MWTSLTLHFANMVDCLILQKLHCIRYMAYIYQRWTLIFCDKFPVVWTFLCCQAYPKEVGPFDHMCLGTKRWWWVRASMKIDPSKRQPEHTRPKFAMLERVALPLASMTPYVYVPQAGCVCVCESNSVPKSLKYLLFSSFRGWGRTFQKNIFFSRGRKQEHQSSSNKDTDVFLVISIGTPMDIPANFPMTSDMWWKLCCGSPFWFCVSQAVVSDIIHLHENHRYILVFKLI